MSENNFRCTCGTELEDLDGMGMYFCARCDPPMNEVQLVCYECDTVFYEPEDNPMNSDCLCPACEAYEIEKAKDDEHE